MRSFGGGGRQQEGESGEIRRRDVAAETSTTSGAAETSTTSVAAETSTTSVAATTSTTSVSSSASVSSTLRRGWDENSRQVTFERGVGTANQEKAMRRRLASLGYAVREGGSRSGEVARSGASDHASRMDGEEEDDKNEDERVGSRRARFAEWFEWVRRARRGFVLCRLRSGTAARPGDEPGAHRASDGAFHRVAHHRRSERG